MATRLVPFQDKMMIGKGFDIISGTPLDSPAAVGTTATITGKKGGQTVTSSIEKITDLDTLHQSLGVNVDAGGSYFGASVDVKVNYAKECNVSKFSTTVLIRVSVMNAFESMEAPILSPDANELLAKNDNVRFHQRFGDFFIDGVQTGGEYYACFEINSTDESFREDVSVQVQAAYNGGVFSAHLDGDVKTSIARSSSHAEVFVHVFQNGAIDTTDQTLDQIITKAHLFPPTVAGEFAVPFAVSLADYKTLKLPSDIVTFLDIQNQQDVLAEHARKRFAFLTLRNDISYVRQHREDFIDVDDAKLAEFLAKVTDAINVMEHEASACLNDPNKCSFTSFDVSDFHLPAAKPGGMPANIGGTWQNTAAGATLTRLDIVRTDGQHAFVTGFFTDHPEVIADAVWDDSVKALGVFLVTKPGAHVGNMLLLASGHSLEIRLLDKEGTKLVVKDQIGTIIEPGAEVILSFLKNTPD